MVAVRKAIIDGLATAFTALPDFNGTTNPERKVSVTYAYPFGGAGAKKAEKVFGGRTRIETPPAALRSGRNYRDETGLFDLVVLVSYVGGDAETADLRAYAIGQVIEEWLADRKSNELNVTGLQTLTVTGGESNNLGNDRGHMTELTYQVRWTARLT